MNRHVLTGNPGLDAPAFLDMAARFPSFPGYGGGFRVGDRAAAHLLAARWRSWHPQERLVVLEDSTRPECRWGRELPGTWVFAGLADEVWELGAGEACERPPGPNLYDRPLWQFWKQLRDYRPAGARPTGLVIPKEARDRADALARAAGLTEDHRGDHPYVTVQPLEDAAYNTGRNRPGLWWQALASQLAAALRVPALLVVPAGRGLPGAVPGCVPVAAPDVLTTLALLRWSRLHVGGETGTTLWAPLLGVPTFAAVPRHSCHAGHDTSPLSVGKPVRSLPLELGADLVAAAAVEFVSEFGLLEAP